MGRRLVQLSLLSELFDLAYTPTVTVQGDELSERRTDSDNDFESGTFRPTDNRNRSHPLRPARGSASDDWSLPRRIGVASTRRWWPGQGLPSVTASESAGSRRDLEVRAVSPRQPARRATGAELVHWGRKVASWEQRPILRASGSGAKSESESPSPRPRTAEQLGLASPANCLSQTV